MTSQSTERAISTQAPEQCAGKHTPGPWRAAYGENWDRLPTESEQEVCCLSHMAFDAVDVFVPLRDGPGPISCSFDEFMANAHLIAAAPELLHIAQEFLAWLKDGIATDISIADLRQKAEAAIAKATHLEQRPSTEGSNRSEQCE